MGFGYSNNRKAKKMILTTPFGKKEGCDLDDKQVMTKGGIAGSFYKLSLTSFQACNTSLILRQARRRNMLNTPSGFVFGSPIFKHSPTFDTCLNQTQLNWNGGVKIW